MLIDSKLVAHMLSGLSVDRQKTLKGLNIVLLMERDQRYDRILANKSLTIGERTQRLADIQIVYTQALREAKEILIEKGS